MLMYPTSNTKYFSNVEARVGVIPVDDTKSTPPDNPRCGFYGGKPREYQTVEFLCPKPGLAGDVITLSRQDGGLVGAMEVQIFGKTN